MPFIILNLIVLLGLALFISNFVQNNYTENLKNQLSADARLIKEAVLPQLASAKPQSNLDPLANYYYQLLGNKITLIAADGAVLGQSGDDDLKSENLHYYPEIQQALANGTGDTIYTDPATGEDTLQLAIKAETDEAVVGFVRLTVPLDEVQSNQRKIRNTILTVTFFTIILTTLLAWLIANRTTRPVRALTTTVNRMADGDLNARLTPSTRDEVAQLTSAFNNMAKQLQEKINALTTEQKRVSVILEHMADGIMIVENDGQVRMINPAAARLLGTTADKATKHTFAEVVRQHQMIELWQKSQQDVDQNREYVEMIETGRKEGRILQVIITPMTTTPSSSLVILQDLTRVRRLETIRRDFISNISHDLRTPLASLNLLVETLQNGALNDPPAADRFLKHMEQEVAVMTQLVSELLELSRIESGQVPLKIKPVRVNQDLILPPVARLTGQAERNGLILYTDLPENLPLVSADPERIQQVITNLLHNAIKFTPPNGSIRIFAYTQSDEVVIAFEDTGVGIPPEDA
ncbi:MAG: cell wall metabolism sensor histidine kinase WalK [Anaerolineaceae bacterium]|nr:cell wall metabolism sensor histidine kinase WalK [Anaerolineaceae bacterium]